MTPTPRFDAVLFDGGGVLVVPDPAVLGPVVARHGGRDDEPTLVRAHFAGVHALDEASTDEERWEAYHRAYAAAAGVPQDAVDDAGAELEATLEHRHWRHPFPGALDTLRGLESAGVPIGVVSNAIGQVRGMLLDEGLCQVGPGSGAQVACIVDSHVVGVAKPDPRIFSFALDALGREAGPRIAYVGDTVFNDVRGAEAAGLTPLLHDPFGFHAGGPHETLPRLATLLELTGG